MRSIVLARLDKTRPVLVLTREVALPHLRMVTIAPITSSIRGLSTEVLVGTANGLDHASAVSCDNITAVPVEALGRRVGFLLPDQEALLAAAVASAFGLE